MLNYNINEDGVLNIYYDNYLIAEISGCKEMKEDKIKELVQNIYKESEFYNNRKEEE